MKFIIKKQVVQGEEQSWLSKECQEQRKLSGVPEKRNPYD
jgi:hypothetical protein